MEMGNEERLRAIGLAIASERERQHISQAELARRLGYTNHAHLSRVESGQKAPSMEMIFSTADALGCRVSYFFSKI